MCCLTCAYFDPTEPPEHKKAREAGRCASNCGDKWNWYTAFRYVGAHAEPLYGACRREPAALNKASWDVCGQHRPVLSGDNGWGVRAFGSKSDDHGLMKFAAEQYQTIKDGGPQRWERERIGHLEKQNQALRKQLATARKRSTSRLARLARLEKAAKPAKADKPAAPQLRLVANA